MTASPLPFRVLELPGPAARICGRLLAEAGADVIKIGPSGTTSQAPDTTALFHDTGKRSLTLDLGQPAGIDLLLELAAISDALVEGLPPGGLAELGCSSETLSTRNPK